MFIILLDKLKNALDVTGLIFKYIIFLLIEGKGSTNYFKIEHRQFNMHIDFEQKTLTNIANHKITTKRRRKRITFWLAFRDQLSIHSIEINGKKLKNFKHYSVTIPFFNVGINYLAIFHLNTHTANFNLTISYQTLFSNLRDDFSSMLENYICRDEFHLFYSWYPILGDKLLVKDILAGKLPRVEPTSFNFEVTLSEPGVVAGEGVVTKLSECQYKVVNYPRMGFSDETPFFLTGGKLIERSFALNQTTNLSIFATEITSEFNHFDDFVDPIFSGIKYVKNLLHHHFDSNQLNIFAIPIIAGGYGLTYSTLVNENAFFMPKEGYIYSQACRLVWHELIHHWWGNAISSEGKGRYLLTEGMTILFEWLTAKEMFGELYFTQVIEQARRQVLQIHGYEKSIANSNRIPPFGNTIIYKKSPLVLYQLMRLVGEEVFISFCADFVKKKGVYQWTDFLGKLEIYADINLINFDQLWVESTDLPTAPDQYTVLYDDRCSEEVLLDKVISNFMLKQDSWELYQGLLSITSEPDFQDKYNYYLGICQLKQGNLSEALHLFEKIDKTDEFYYGQGLYESACIHKDRGNFKEYRNLMEKLVTGPYLFDDPRWIYDEYRNLSSNIRGAI